MCSYPTVCHGHRALNGRTQHLQNGGGYDVEHVVKFCTLSAHIKEPHSPSIFRQEAVLNVFSNHDDVQKMKSSRLLSSRSRRSF
jgi:hypothetical protein